MNKPKLLDLFCGAGGIAMGYYQAGFDIIGVDIVDQPRYPFTFVQSDAFEYLTSTSIDRIAVIHASPQCQRYTRMLNHGIGDRNKHPDLVAITREALQATNKPYVIENVVGSPIIKSIMLCGIMFGLRVYRHRHFESNVLLFQPHHPHHTARIAHAGNIPTPEQFYCPVGHLGDKAGAQRAMGIDWMTTQKEIANTIPPAYSHYIGLQLLTYLESESAA